jgi:glycosyltransferase involved in cell wall biosynthesis
VTPSSPAPWHIITCEYPPETGGVSDYTLVLASALAAAGCETHVWCPQADRPARATAGVTVHATLGRFGFQDLRRAGRQIAACRAPRRLFVQWVPHGYGWQSLNVLFAAWLASRALLRRDELHVMVHEPFLQFSGSPRTLAAGLVHRLMLLVACAGASRVWLSIPKWGPEIRPYVPRRVPIACLPIPAPSIGTISVKGHDARRRELFPNGEPVVGHFGTFSALVTSLLAPALDVVLEKSTARVLLIGRGSGVFRSQLVEKHPDMADRIVATGTLESEDIAPHVRACDVMVQPYPDGISARRTSSLALLRAGLPVVTNEGWLTEPFWRTAGAVTLADNPDGARVGEAAVDLLADSARREALSVRAQELYNQRFDAKHAVAPLIAAQ